GDAHIKTIGGDHTVADDPDTKYVLAVGEDRAAPDKHLFSTLERFIIRLRFCPPVDARHARAMMAGHRSKDIDLHALEPHLKVGILVSRISEIVVIVVVVPRIARGALSEVPGSRVGNLVQ